MPTTQSVISSTYVPLAGSATFTSAPEKILNFTGADISLFSDQPCLITIYGGPRPSTNGPWTQVFTSGITTANVGFSATYLTFYPYSYLTITNQSETPQTILEVAHILRVHSHIMETTVSSIVVADVNVLSMPPISGTVGITGSIDVATLPPISGTVGITGSIDVSTLPPISGTVGITGSIDVATLPPISGTVGITGGVDVATLPPISGTVGITGGVDVSTLPPISGTVGITGSVDVATLSSITYTGSSLNTYDTNLATCISGGLLNVLPSVAQSSTIVWSDGSAPISTGQSKASPFQALIVGAIGRTRVSIYGSVISLDPNVSPLTITIVYSQTGAYGTWYNSSNGVLSFSQEGDFSRDFETSAPYVSAYVNSYATAVLLASAI